VPLSSGVLSFPVLKFTVFDDQLEELVGEGDAAAACPGLDLDFDQASAVTIRAPASVAGAIRWTWWWTGPLDGRPSALCQVRLDGLALAPLAEVQVIVDGAASGDA